MSIQYQQCDLQTLFDLLAEETKKYTQAVNEGIKDEIYRRNLSVNTIIAEIKKRRNKQTTAESNN